jgi:uncharacterized membrane protein
VHSGAVSTHPGKLNAGADIAAAAAPVTAPASPSRGRRGHAALHAGRPRPRPGAASVGGDRHSHAGAAGRVAATLGGAALLAYASQRERRRSWLGIGMALTGAPLVYRGLTGHWPVSRALAERAASPIIVETSVTIYRPAGDLYAFWRQLENLPRFMHGIDEVTQDGNRSRWVGRMPLGLTMRWEAEIVEDQPGRLLSWRSLPGAQVQTAGSVLFEDATGGRGTVVRVAMEICPPGSGFGRALGKALSPGTGQQVHEDLRRFKSLMEAGEVPTAVPRWC